MDHGVVGNYIAKHSTKFHGNVGILQHRENSTGQLKIPWPVKKLWSLQMSVSVCYYSVLESFDCLTVTSSLSSDCLEAAAAAPMPVLVLVAVADMVDTRVLISSK